MRRGFCCSPFCTVCLLLSQSYAQNTPHNSNFSLQPNLLEPASLFFPFRTCTKLCAHTHTHRQSKTLPPPLYLPNKQNLTAKLVPGMHPCTNIHTQARVRTCTHTHNESLVVIVRSASIVYGFTDPLLAFFMRTTHSS